VDPARLGTVENHSHRPEVERARQTGLGFDRRRSTTVSEPFLYAARRLDRQGSPVGFLRFAVSENEIRRSEEPFRTRLTALSTLTGLLAGLLLLAIRRRHFSELHVLREAVKGASLGQEPHVTLQTSSETAEILSTLGEITRRLASADARGAGGEELLATVLENVPSGVLTFDTGLKLVSANEIAARILGLPQDRLKKGAHALEICRDTSFSRSLERAIAGEGSTELALPLEGRTLKVVVAGAGVGRAGGARGAVAVIAGT
jgi:two-component system phosphate regulon sensor histidine kinase PhoR